eukprot:scaffold16650_cov38-Cyclotella_meneghiniana.AAC.4
MKLATVAIVLTSPLGVQDFCNLILNMVRFLTILFLPIFFFLSFRNSSRFPYFPFLRSGHDTINFPSILPRIPFQDRAQEAQQYNPFYD